MSDNKIADLVTGIRHAVMSYRVGELSLQRLIWSIEERLSILGELADPEWVDELRTLSNDLEYVNAFFIESGRDSLDEAERHDVSRTVGRLIQLVGDA